MARALTNFLRATSLYHGNVPATSDDESSAVNIRGASRVAFLIDVGKNETVATASDAAIATLAVQVQFKSGATTPATDGWTVATDISASVPPTTGNITWADTTAAGGLYVIDMNLESLGLYNGFLKCLITPGASSDAGALPLDIIALTYGYPGWPTSPGATVVESWST